MSWGWREKSEGWKGSSPGSPTRKEFEELQGQLANLEMGKGKAAQAIAEVMALRQELIEVEHALNERLDAIEKAIKKEE